METIPVIGLTILGVVLGLGFGYLLARLAIARRKERDGVSAEDMVTSARLDAQRILSKAEEEGRAKAEAYREREDVNLEHRRLEMSNLESRLGQREETLDQRASNLAQREKMIIDREEELNGSRGELERLKEEARFRLEQVAGIDVTAAKTEMLAQVEDEARREAMIVVRDLEIKAREEADRRARRILATAIQRLSSEVVTETTVSVVQLPSDDMKGRIIGREGRNIRTSRIGDRDQPHRRRHPGGGFGVLVRPGPARGGPYHPGEAGGRRPHTPCLHRRGLREGAGRGGAERPGCRRVGPASRPVCPACTRRS